MSIVSLSAFRDKKEEEFVVLDDYTPNVDLLLDMQTIILNAHIQAHAMHHHGDIRAHQILRMLNVAGELFRGVFITSPMVNGLSVREVGPEKQLSVFLWSTAAATYKKASEQPGGEVIPNLQVEIILEKEDGIAGKIDKRTVIDWSHMQCQPRTEDNHINNRHIRALVCHANELVSNNGGSSTMTENGMFIAWLPDTYNSALQIAIMDESPIIPREEEK